MAENALKFYKGWYGKGNSKTLPNESKAIIFNEEEGIIYVNGKSYSGATDVTFANGVLTISYADGRDNVTLDFNDTASAQATLKVFDRIDNLIGPNVNVANGDGTLNYTNTNYLTNETTLVAADKALDTAIKAVDTRIDNLDTQSDVQAVTLTAASGNNGAKLTFNGVSQNDGAIAAGTSTTELQFAKVATTGAAEDVSYSNTTSGMSATNVQSAIDALDSRLDDIETIDTFDTVVSSDAASTPSGTSWTSGEDTITGSLAASADTMHKIYLVPDTHETAEHTGTYNEYISVRTGTSPNFTYTWELIGSTKADLTGYVKTVVVNGKEYAVTNNTTQITLTDVITAITGESTTDLNNTDFVNVKATTTKDTQLGTNITTLVSSVKVGTIAAATSADNGLATALDVRNTIEGLDADFTGNNAASDTNGNVTVSLQETNGVVNSLGVAVSYATVTKTDGTAGTGSTTGTDSTLVVTNGDETKLVTGADIAKVVTFTNNRIAEEIAKLDATVTSNNNNQVEVTVTETDGAVSGVSVSTTAATVVFDNTASDEDLTATNANGIVLGSDIAQIKGYIDAKASDSATVVTNSNGSADALVLTSSNNNGKMTYDINLCWTEWADNSQNNNQGN